jgi:hypothetical protein
LKPAQDPTFALIGYHDEAERDAKIASLAASVRSIVCIPYECETIEEWQAQVKADEERRRREEETEHPHLTLIRGYRDA